MRQTKSLSLTSAVPLTAGLCRLLSAPAGRWPFPTLSLQSLCGRLVPYTAVLLCCSCPFLHREQRPPRLENALGAHKHPPQCNFHGEPISVLQTFRYVQARALARPPGCTHRSPCWAARPFTPRIAQIVTFLGCGIATCPFWATDTAGLSPAGLQSCRLLLPRYGSKFRRLPAHG